MKLIKLILNNKLTTIIIVLSVVGLTVASITSVKLIQYVKNGDFKIETTASTTKKETTTESTTELTTTKTTTETTTKPTTTKAETTTKKPDPVINSSNVKSIFKPLISHYTSLEQGTHNAIGVDYTHNYREELMTVICEQTDWTELGIESVYKFKTVKSVAEVKRIYKKYLSSDIVNQADLNLFSYNNELYAIYGAKGSYEYNANSITYKGKKDGGYVVAIDAFLGNGAYLSTESFLVKYIDGRFKIVKKLGEEQIHPNDYYVADYERIY